jgi:phenylalanyl-tRNA synthetase beta chain
MKVSLNWAQYVSNVDLKSDVYEAIVERIGRQLGAVEDVELWGPRYEGAVVARVVTCEKHPDADKLSVCRIDDGGVTNDVERGEDGLVQVVCGAPNVRAGLTVCWLPPGSTVPSTYTDTEPFVLGARELRGVMSNGMLASPSELGISDNHDGILEIAASDVGEENITPGTSFKKLYAVDDVIIDCENKMFTHRPDCFGILGVARELAGIKHQAFKSPHWYATPVEFESVSDLPLNVLVETKAVPRFMAVVIKDITVKPSPYYMQAGLSRVGIRPINNIVDITNWLMQLTGQPLHAYDYDKVKARSKGTPTLIARHVSGDKPEKINLLNGKQVELKDASDIVIATDQEVVGIGGVMGGADTEVDEHTKTIILECANFDMYSIRRTSMRYGLFTDAVTRFNKGQSALQNDRILAEAMKLVAELASGKQASNVYDEGNYTKELMPAIQVSTDFINERLGSNLTPAQITDLLTNIECVVEENDTSLSVQPPFWRKDLELAEDIVEEVGRLFGYDNLPINLPLRPAKPGQQNELIALKSNLRRTLASLGANEVLSYSFVHGNLLEKVGQNPTDSYQLGNALSPELQYYRQSLTPSLLEKVHPNNKAGFGEFALFEIGKAHNKVHGNDSENLPGELEMIALVYAANAKHASRHEGAAFYQARAYLDALAKKLGIGDLVYEPVPDDTDYPVTRPFDISRSALVSTNTGQFLGIIGEFKKSVLASLKLPEYSAGFEFGTKDVLSAVQGAGVQYVPASKYPSVTQDISLKLSENKSYKEVYAALSGALAGQLDTAVKTSCSPLDIYSAENVLHMTFRVTFVSYNATLKASDVNTTLDAVARELEKSIGAVRI